MSRSYGNFRQCLRWEFGFTCCICLTHEADLFEHGTEKTALIHIEHRQTLSASPAEANLYDNCLLVCRLCNVARGALPVTSASGARLSSPAEDAWADHFVADGDRLLPRDGDPHALYTHDSYDLDDPRKVAMREFRRTRIPEWLKVVREGPTLRDELMERGIEERRTDLIEKAQFMDDLIRRAFRDLARFHPIPRDAARDCHCRRAEACSLPPQVAEQTIPFPVDRE